MNVQNEKGEVFCNYKCFSPQSELVWQIVSLLIDVQFCQNIIIKDVDFKPPLNSLWWPVYIINLVDDTKVPNQTFVSVINCLFHHPYLFWLCIPTLEIRERTIF